MRKIVSTATLLCLTPLLLSAQSFWDGAGAGGSSNDWGLGSNWDPTGVPGAGSTVNVALTEGTVLDYAVEIPDEAVGGDVTFSGLTREDNRQILFQGDATFTTLFVNYTGTAVNIQELVELDGTLDLLGGSVETPSLRWGPVGATRSPFVGTGTIRFHADNAFVNIAGNSLYNLVFLSDDEEATIDFANTAPSIGGSLQVRSTQTLTGLGDGISLTGGDIVSLDGQPLDNFSGVHLIANRHSQGGGVTLSDLAAGTYGSLRVTNAHNGNNSQIFRLAGDITLDSAISLELEEDNPLEYTMALNRYRLGSANYGEIRTDGYNITATGINTGRIQIGNPVVEDVVEASNNFIDLSSGSGGSSVVHIAGDFALGSNGYLIAPDGAGAILILESSFESVSARNTLFDGAGLSLRMQGSGDVSNPQELELPGADLGTHDPGDPFANNFYMEELVIGSVGTPTWVDLVNHHSYDPGGDALYVGSLLVNAGSVLALNNHALYVDGVLVQPGDTQYGDGLIVIPEPSYAALLLALLGAMGWAYRRQQQRFPD